LWLLFDDLEGVINANIEGIFVDPNDERFKSSEIQKLRTFEQQRLRKKGLINVPLQLFPRHLACHSQ
jgi:hypothetical protein